MFLNFYFAIIKNDIFSKLKTFQKIYRIKQNAEKKEKKFKFKIFDSPTALVGQIISFTSY